MASNKQMGQGMTEYIIIVALIAITAIGVYSFLEKQYATKWPDFQVKFRGKTPLDKYPMPRQLPTMPAIQPIATTT